MEHIIRHGKQLLQTGCCVHCLMIRCVRNLFPVFIQQLFHKGRGCQRGTHDIGIFLRGHLAGQVSGNGHFTKSESQRQRSLPDLINLHQLLDVVHRNKPFSRPVLFINLPDILIRKPGNPHLFAALRAYRCGDCKLVVFVPDCFCNGFPLQYVFCIFSALHTKIHSSFLCHDSHLHLLKTICKRMLLPVKRYHNDETIFQIVNLYV